MTIKSRKFTKGIRLKATDDEATLDGEIRNDKTNEKLKVNLEGTEKEIITNDQIQELENKTLDGNKNTIINIDSSSIGDLVTDLTQPVTNSQVAGAQAIKDYVGNTASASSSDLIFHMSDKSTHGVDGELVGTTDVQTLENKIIDSASNTITVDADTAAVSNIETGNFKAGVIDTDVDLTADLDTRIASQKAVKAYVDSATSGIVTDASGVDYTQAEVSDWQHTHTNVAEPLDELASRASLIESDFNDHLYGTDPKHNSDKITYDPTTSGLLATNVQEALDEIKQTLGSGNAADITYDDTTSQLGATDVQAAIEQLTVDVGNAGNDVQATRSYYVCENSGSDTNLGSLLQPFATIQKAIDQIILDGVGGSSAVINVDYGFYNENLVLAEAYNIMIIGKGMTDTQNCWITGTVDLTNSENIKFKNFRIDPGESGIASPVITMDRNTPTNVLVDSGGRHVFESCLIHNKAVGQKALELKDGVVTDYNVFRECTFIGAIDLTQSSNQNTSVTFIECSAETAPITVSNTIFSAVDCYSLGHVTHTSGIVALKDIHTMERSGTACIDSTASIVDTTSIIYLEDVSTYDLIAGYGSINITGLYALNGCSRDPSVDTITGIRITMGQRSQDIAYDNSDSGLTATDVKSAIDEVKALTGSGAGLSNTIWADSNASVSGDGSLGTPFQSLQDAIDAAELLGKETRKIIMIASGSAFDEDVVITGGLISLMALGPCTLGDGAGSAFSSTTPRSLTYNNDGALTNGKWPSLVIATIMDDEVSSTHTAYMNGFTISGDLNFDSGSVSHNIQLRNVKVQGNYVQTGVGGVQTYLRRCFFDNLFTGNSTILNIADSCEFVELVTVIQHNRIWQCEITNGFTTGGIINSLPPNGMYETNFKGVFTGPAGSLLLDTSSNYFFNTNSATLAGGATKVLIHDDESAGGSGTTSYISTTDIDENQTLNLTAAAGTAITNATITFTSDGSPIEVSLISSGSSSLNPSFVGVSKGSPAQTVFNLHLYEGVTEVEMIQLQGYSNTTWQQGVNCVKFYVLNPPVGSVTYTLRHSVQSGTHFGSLRKCRILVKTL